MHEISHGLLMVLFIKISSIRKFKEDFFTSNVILTRKKTKVKELRIIIFFGFLLSLVGCDFRSHLSTPENSSKPYYGDWGIDLSARNNEVDPGDDFFEYANGKWVIDNEIPSDRSRHGVWLELRERVEKRLLEIVENKDGIGSTKNTSQQKITDYYASWMNIDLLNQLGLAPLKKDIKRIKSITSRWDLAGEFGRQYFIAGASPFYARVSVNPLNPDEYQIQLGLSGLGLPDRDYYLEDTERFRNIRLHYERYIANIIEFAIETGMRRSEILKLRWCDVDLESGFASLYDTKNGEDRRVPLTKRCIEVLQTMPQTDERVFPISATCLRLAWNRARKKAGITDLRFHDSRHKAESRFFEMGMSVPGVALISGHKDARQLFRYTHLNP